MRTRTVSQLHHPVIFEYRVSTSPRENKCLCSTARRPVEDSIKNGQDDTTSTTVIESPVGEKMNSVHGGGNTVLTRNVVTLSTVKRLVR